MTVRLDGRVAIVTGAGSGLGREHALLLAKTGAKVVVNDLGGAVNGDGASQSAADSVVAEIKAAGGEAAANYDSVGTAEGGRHIVQTAMDHFGRVDILINNAGILRDKSFGKMEIADYELVLQVHLLGSMFCTKAAWPIMTEQKYGRIVMTTSVAGHGGNFGQANYGSAKMGLLGLMNCLAVEGRKNNILVNAVSPGAQTRMTVGLVSETFGDYLKPEFVSPAVVWLASEACNETATIITAGAAGYGKLQFFETEGVQFDPRKPVTVDMFADAFSKISDLSTAKPVPLGVAGKLEERFKTFKF